MNVIFATQGAYISFYLELLESLGEKVSLDKVGFYLTEKNAYEQCQVKAGSLDVEVKFLTEWEIIRAAGESADCNYLEQIEAEFGEPFLWNPLVVDRRIYNGVSTKYRQDYKPRFAHDKMIGILEKGFRHVLTFIDDIEPDVIVGGFTPVTFGEYIFYLCAKNRSTKYLNLNPTKIQNYVTMSEEIYREFPHVREDYKEYLNKEQEDSFLKEGKRYLQSKSKKYEGVIISSRGFPWKKWCSGVFKWPFVVANYYLKKAYSDNQQRGYHLGFFFNNIFNPLKDAAAGRFLPYFPVEKLDQIEYVYYPLHVEPEIALSIFGREYLNQIELVRNISRCIPVTWKLVVKDHPAGVGRRNLGYYRKLLEIPNVTLVNHYAEANHIIEKAKMVFTVSGFSGFEAILRKKPVITFGKTFYDVLPDCMVQNVKYLQTLPLVVKELLETYHYCESEIVCLVAAIMKNSVPLNLYTQVLKKQGRVAIDSEALDGQKSAFVDYLASQMRIAELEKI